MFHNIEYNGLFIPACKLIVEPQTTARLSEVTVTLFVSTLTDVEEKLFASKSTPESK